MTYYIEQCVSRTLNGSKWERIAGTDRDDFTAACSALATLSNGSEDMLRVGRGEQ